MPGKRKPPRRRHPRESLSDVGPVLKAVAAWAATDRRVDGFAAVLVEASRFGPSLQIEIRWWEPSDRRVLTLRERYQVDRDVRGLGAWVVRHLRKRKSELSRAYREGRMKFADGPTPPAGPKAPGRDAR